METNLLIRYAFGIIICLASCKKNDSGTPAAPVINSINPETGPKNTVVTISGNNFGTDISKVKVFFNGMAATVQSVNNNQVAALVPAKANTGTVKVDVTGTTVEGPVFNYVLTVSVTSIAGNGTRGFVDGPGNTAAFALLSGIAIDGNGNLFVADQFNNCIRKIIPGNAVVVSTFAGSTLGMAGIEDGTGTAARFNYPTGLSFDAQGNLIVGDILSSRSRIRKITAAGIVTTLAGSAGEGYVDGPVNTAEFSAPTGVATDGQSNIYVADFNNNRIRKITAGGVVSTLAGSGQQGLLDGVGTAAKFYSPAGITVDSQGNLYVADADNNGIRKITTAGVVTTICAGFGFADGNLSQARFRTPRNMAIDGQGNIYVADGGNNRIRKITAAGTVSTIAGNDIGFADGDAITAKFNTPYALVLDAQGNIYVTDTYNYRVRKIMQE
jgi:hypothetical protein